MRLVFLNAWYGTLDQPIKDFVSNHTLDADIFCFQEASDKVNNLFDNMPVNYELKSAYKCLNKDDEFLQSTFIKNDLKIQTCKTLLSDEPDTGLCLYSKVQDKDKILNVCNVHGISRPGDKLDTPGRLKQSLAIIEFLKNVDGPKIIGGDFNLEYDTQSVKMFEENGYRNLIKDYKISTTRNNLAWERYPDSKQYFADYVFVSPDVNVLNFSVPEVEISDHLPLILDIA